MEFTRTKYILISILSLISGNSLHAMKAMSTLYAPRSFWPPLLWCAYESPAIVAVRLKEHNIPIKEYIEGQLHNARNQTLKAIQTEQTLLILIS